MELVDTHCHLDIEPLAGSIENVLERAKQAGVVQCVSIGTSVEASRANVALARRHPEIFAAVGVHPNDAETVTQESLQAIDMLAQDARVVAIGEIGLDYYRNEASPQKQDWALRAFLAIAQKRSLPLLIHCREAYQPLIAALKQEGGQTLRGLIHCASGPVSFIEEALALGFYISFAGNVTFPNAEKLRELLSLVPDDRLLVETDSPFLAPQPVRGKKNEPAFIAHTAAHIAQLRKVDAKMLAATTTQNARKLLRLPSP